MRVKFKSRQAIRIASGETDASFHTYDEVGERCAEINQFSFDWAMNASHPKVVERYNKFGQKMVQVADRNTDNGGKWIIVPLSYTDNSDKTEVSVSSYAYRMSAEFSIAIFAGDHYCKVLSPFKAMEWIYTDSLYAKMNQDSQTDEEY